MLYSRILSRKLTIGILLGQKWKFVVYSAGIAQEVDYIAFVFVLLTPYLSDFDKYMYPRNQHLLDLRHLRQIRHISREHVAGVKKMEFFVLIPIM
jgi:hypothetical protein